MDKPIIQLTNYVPHPTNEEYVVFMFHVSEMAAHFEMLLDRELIKFEKSIDDDHEPVRTLYAIRRSRLKQALPLNFEAIGKYRKPMINNGFWRWLLIGFVLVVAALAIYGASK